MLLFLPHATNALTLATRTPRTVSPKMATVDMPPPPGFVWAEDLNDTPSPEVGVVVAAPAPAAAPATTGGLPDGLTLDTLTEASALALEGSDLEAVAQALRVDLFKSPPFMEKQQQPRRRMLALVYEKLGDLGKAEPCAREVAKVEKGNDLGMQLLIGKCEMSRGEPFLAAQTYERALALDQGSSDAAAGLAQAKEALEKLGGA